jgi:hypothetical protein
VSAAVVDPLARPRIGVMAAAGDDAWTAAMARRTLVLAMLGRLPRAQVEVLVARPEHAGPSALDCGRPPRQLAAGGADRRRLDLVVAVSDAELDLPLTGAEVELDDAAAHDECEVLQLGRSAADTALLAAEAAADLRRNRLGVMRLLGWLPDEATPFVLVDGGDSTGAAAVATALDVCGAGVAVVLAAAGAEGGDVDGVRTLVGAQRCRVVPAQAGPDEVVAALACAAAYAGSRPLHVAIATGAGVPASVDSASIVAALRGTATPPSRPHMAAELGALLDAAASAAVERWIRRGSPGATPDDAWSRRVRIEQAALRVEIHRLEREPELLGLHVNHLETELRRVLGSRTWRSTEGARQLYRAARRRLRR